MSDLPPSQPYETGHHSFPTTHWSMVHRAGNGTEGEMGEALAALCRDYWYPLYAYVRRRGHSPHDAQDLTQSFIQQVIEGPLLSRPDPEKGRFRFFMLGSLRNFLAKEYRRQQTEKRGGRERVVSLDEELDERRFLAELTDMRTPEAQFERTWALALLARVMGRLQGEYQRAGRLDLFEVLQPYLAGKAGNAGYAEAGAQLGLRENTVAVSIHRMRRRYGELLREEIAATVSTPEEIDDEITHLRAILASG